jgi:hypothetical protein
MKSSPSCKSSTISPQSIPALATGEASKICLNVSNTALKAVKTLSEAASDKDNFMKKMFYDIQQSFENLISKLENDVG